MKIKIDALNSDKIDDVLLSVNGNAKSFCVISFEEVCNISRIFSEMMENDGLLIKERANAVCVYRPVGPSAKSYKYKAKSTMVEITFGSDGKTAYLTGVGETVVYPGQCQQINVKLKPENKTSWVNRIILKYN